MYRHLRALICALFSILKFSIMKLFDGKNFEFPLICFCSPFSEVDRRGGFLHIGNGFKMRSRCHLRVRGEGFLYIGDNVSLNYGDMIVCHNKIIIGNDVQFGPNVLVYDHDHDFRTEGGVKTSKFITSPVYIGNNVWIGANVVILRGSVIGDNCVVGAGTVVKGTYSDNSLIMNKLNLLKKTYK